MTLPPDILSLAFPLRTYDLDPRGRLSPVAIARFFQEAAATHATLWGFGAEGLLKSGTFWAMYRFAAEFGDLPPWQPNTTVTLTTWSRGNKRLVNYRDFELVDASNNKLAAGSSAWIALDIASRRPHRLDVKPNNFPHFPERFAINPAAVEEALPPPAISGSALLAHTVAYSDLDMNGHVNNTRYADWIMDALGPAHWQTQRVAAITANYLAETLAGTPLQIFATPARDSFAIRHTGPEAGDACRMTIRTGPA